MTKARARVRAKARAAAKAANPVAKDKKPEVKKPAGQFDAKSNSMKNMSGAKHIQVSGGMKRGSARSR